MTDAEFDVWAAASATPAHVSELLIALAWEPSEKTREKLIPLIAHICLGSRQRMQLLVDHYRPYLNFNRYATNAHIGRILMLPRFSYDMLVLQPNSVPVSSDLISNDPQQVRAKIDTFCTLASSIQVR
jgi:hypothetical protein